MPELDILSPQPVRHFKRKASPSDFVDGLQGGRKHRKKLHPHPTRSESILRWLDEVYPSSRIQHSRSDSFLTHIMAPHPPDIASRADSARSLPAIAGMPMTPQSSVHQGVTTHQSPVFDMPPPSVPLSQTTGPSGSLEDSTKASRKQRNALPGYRDELQSHCVFLDPFGLSIPDAVRDFASRLVAKPRTSCTLPEGELRSIHKSLSSLINADQVITSHGFCRMSLFPEEYGEGIFVGANIPYDKAGLPYVRGFNFPPIVQPVPDLHYVYQRSSFDNFEFSAMLHSRLTKYSYPTSVGYWPFFTVETKSASRGGTHWVAENQNAGSGAHSVNSLETLLAYSRKATQGGRQILDSIAFSCNVDINSVSLWVHWCDYWPEFGVNDPPRFISAKIDSYHMHKPAELRSLWSGVRNIIDFGVDTRLPTIKRALKDVLPQIPQWDTEARVAKVRSRSSSDQSVSTRWRGSVQE